MNDPDETHIVYNHSYRNHEPMTISRLVDDARYTRNDDLHNNNKEWPMPYKISGFYIGYPPAISSKSSRLPCILG